MKILWKGIKNILNLKSNNLDASQHFKDTNGSQIKNPEKIANEFNHFFTNVANEITKKISSTLKYPLF